MQSSEVARRCLDRLGPGHVELTRPNLYTQGSLTAFLTARVETVDIDSEAGPVPHIASLERCLRPDDMQVVGRTGHHGTFFQMATAMSMGSDVAAHLMRAAWELTTDDVSAGGLGIPAEHLHVVVATDGIATLWASTVGLDESQIIRRAPASPEDAENPAGATVLSDVVLNGDPTAQERPGLRPLKLWSLQRSEDGNATAVGLGVERLAMAVQDVATIADTDQLRPVVDHIALLTGTEYGDTDPGSVAAARLRIAGDHVRTALMLADAGVTAADGELGPVLVRVVRRGAHALRLLGFDEPALAELLPIARDLMAPAYPSVAADYERIERVLVDVEAQLLGTLPVRTVTPAVAMTAAATFSHSELELLEGVRAESGATDSLAFETLQASVRVVAILAAGELVATATPGSTVDVVLDHTPFFAERCGQASDQGTLHGDELVATVVDARWAVPDLVVHRVRVDEGELQVGADLTAAVDLERRIESCQAHTAIHVLQGALRDELGEGAIRLASSDEPGRLVLQLDGSLPWSEDIAGVVEDIANETLRSDLVVSAHIMRRDEARACGALYAHIPADLVGDTVRVVEIDGTWSREVCDGTHVLHTSQIGLITIVDSGVTPSGQLQIEAMCGLDGLQRLTRDRDLVRALSATARVSRQQLMTLVERMDTADITPADAGAGAREFTELARSGTTDGEGDPQLAEGPIDTDERQNAITRIRMKIGVVTGSLGG